MTERNPALDRTDPIDASVTKLIREKERLAYWACRVLIYLETNWGSDVVSAQRERAQIHDGLTRLILDLNYDWRRLGRVIALGEPK